MSATPDPSVSLDQAIQRLRTLCTGDPRYEELMDAVQTAFVAELAERDRIREELKQARDLAETANRTKDIFLANMSHELRTPLTAVIGATELVLQSRLTDEQRQALDAANRAGQELLVLINDILDYSKLDANKVQLVSAPFDPRRLAEDAFAAFSGLARRKQLAYDLTVASEVPRAVVGDALRIKQILSNLLSNAIKFTDRGGKVRLSLAVDEHMGDHTRLVFAVEDTGEGITPEQQARLFTPFTQGSLSGSRRAAGTGLGLAICRALNDLMGGTLRLESTPGCGSRFSLVLELPTASRSGVMRAVSGAPTTTPERLAGHVLIADDNEFTRVLLKQALSNMGLQVHIVASGNEAVNSALETHYDAILMDCEMPDLDGYQAAKALRGHGVEAPIIAVTANTGRSERERCRLAGMQDYISKPFGLVELKEVLGCWLAGQQSDPTPPPAVDNVEREAGLDVHHLSKLLDDKDALRELCRLFARDTRRQLVALSHALTRRDLPGVKAISHSIKGSAANLGAHRLSDLAASLERDAAANRVGGAQTLKELHSEHLKVLQALVRSGYLVHKRPHASSP